MRGCFSGLAGAFLIRRWVLLDVFFPPARCGKSADPGRIGYPWVMPGWGAAVGSGCFAGGGADSRGDRRGGDRVVPLSGRFDRRHETLRGDVNHAGVVHRDVSDRGAGIYDFHAGGRKAQGHFHRANWNWAGSVYRSSHRYAQRLCSVSAVS